LFSEAESIPKRGIGDRLRLLGRLRSLCFFAWKTILFSDLKDRVMLDSQLDQAAALIAASPRVAALTGAGISAESGVPTFRGADGLWKTYRAEALATPEAFAHDPALVWEWYDWRRGLIAPVEPTAGHAVLAAWERRFEGFTVITQNVDGLHARAGSRSVVELHGNIWKLRCTREGTVEECRVTPLARIPPVCAGCGALLRPHVVWFGEALDPAVLRRAFAAAEACQAMLVIGTSAVVEPAASLPRAAAQAGAKIVELNIEPTPLTPLADVYLPGKAGEILPLLDERLKGRTSR
jgi:NAD-dependent deacetylase